MITRFIWRKCDMCADADAYWLEASQEEAESLVFPSLAEIAVEQSRRHSEETGRFAELIMGKPGLTFCFLVSRDLKYVLPFHVNYPVHHMWNAYSPFEKIPEKEIRSLEEIRKI